MNLASSNTDDEKKHLTAIGVPLHCDGASAAPGALQSPRFYSQPTYSTGGAIHIIAKDKRASLRASVLLIDATLFSHRPGDRPLLSFMSKGDS
ncbi:2-oxoglutarate dehydrogenase E1 component, partial [Exophiala xenobiotica]